MVAFNTDTAIVEVANTCGLATLPGGERGTDDRIELRVRRSDPSGAHMSRDCLVLALGGSASTDGGIGMLAALGYRFLDRSGELLNPTGENLGLLHCVDLDMPLDTQRCSSSWSLAM